MAYGQGYISAELIPVFDGMCSGLICRIILNEILEDYKVLIVVVK